MSLFNHKLGYQIKGFDPVYDYEQFGLRKVNFVSTVNKHKEHV